MSKAILNPQYIRLMKDGHFVGFGRIICEFLPAGEDTWRLKAIDWDERKVLIKPPVGIAISRRAQLPKQD